MKPWWLHTGQTCYRCGVKTPSGFTHCDPCYAQMSGQRYKEIKDMTDPNTLYINEKNTNPDARKNNAARPAKRG